MRNVTRLSIRIDFEPSGSALGPGMVQLLERVAEKGSIRSAAASLDMSYRKAWLLIREMQKTFNGEIVTAAKGGVAGGGTHLTELGAKLVDLYHRVESRAAAAARRELESLAAQVQDNAPKRKPRRARRPPIQA